MATKTYYLSGPITGYPEGNKPAFDKAKAFLVSKGYDVVSPFDGETEEETSETLKDKYGKMYWGAIAKDLAMLSKADALILMPGWAQSKGARIEATVGLLFDKTFRYLGENGFPIEMKNWQVADSLRRSFAG